MVCDAHRHLGDHEGELAKPRAATGDGELARLVFHDTFATLDD